MPESNTSESKEATTARLGGNGDGTSTAKVTGGEPAAKAVIYVRVSTKEQAERGGETEGFSIPAQREACERKAASMEAVVVERFIERGESAKTADRPELQRLLAFVAEHPIQYVIVHKVDRLARNRADDVTITLAIRQAGAELVSVSENIDQTPSGLLLHGIMSSIAEFYSRNLATEIIKGSVQKAKNGGTPTRAPLGYRNVRLMEQGREVRTIEVDTERAPLIAWAFEAYATGEWTVRRLVAELNRRGLTTTPGPRTPSKPLSDTQLQKLLRHPYYLGLVRYRGVLYPGKHPALVDPETWQAVQDLLSARNLAGEKQREHPHYLKGSIYCGTCGARLIVNHAKNRHGSVYPYFVCLGRQQDKHSCSQRALRIELVETAVAAHYASVQLRAPELAAVRAFMEEELASVRLGAEQERKAQRQRQRQLEAEQQALLDAHLAEAVPLDLLKAKQDTMTAKLETIRGRLVEIEADFARAESNLTRALAFAGNCHAAYGEGSPTVRRQFNLAFFERLLIDEHYDISGELAPPFATLLGDPLRRATVEQADEDLRQRVQEALREREGRKAGLAEHSRASLSGVDSPTTSYEVVGWSQEALVELAGLEPATSWLPGRRSDRRARAKRSDLQDIFGALEPF
jgi:site-specific DNA recombinase